MQPMFSMGWLFVGLFGLAALAVGIPLLVVLLVHPKSRRAIVSALRFAGWAIVCVTLLVLIPGSFFHVRFHTAPAGGQAGTGTTEPAADHVVAPPPVPYTAGPPAADLPIVEVPHAPAPSHVASLREGLLPSRIVQDVRPPWVDQPPGNEGPTYNMPVKSGLWTTEAECQQALQGTIAKAVDEYLASYLGDDRAAQWIDIDPAYLRQRLIRQSMYAETVDASVGKMQQLHALLEFDDQLRAEFQRLWRQACVSHRLRYAGGGFALILTALAALFGYLKLDLATGGRHSGRLRWASALAILLVAAGAVGICVL